MRKKFVLLIVVINSLTLSSALYKIGVGIADCTGPAAEVTFVRSLPVLEKKYK